VADRAPLRLDGRLAIALVLLAGIVAVGVAMATGLVPDLLETIARPAPILQAILAGGAIVVGGRLLLAALRRISAAFERGSADDADAGVEISDVDLGAMVRGVRLVFLAAAAFAAAGGWILGEPLPLVIALVIAGVDVVETSFLLLVATRR
jgi:hypothetical protein